MEMKAGNRDGVILFIYFFLMEALQSRALKNEGRIKAYRDRCR